MGNNDLYNGSSEGFGELVDAYIDYGKEVVARRSNPDLRDGLKPVGRNILEGARKIDNGDFAKCSTVVGEIMKLHPHGDTSIYEALASMSDKNGTLNIPYFSGSGALGRVFSSDKPAAMRYPKAKLCDNAKELFRDLRAVDFKLSDEGDGEVPEVFPARFPVVLVNGTKGIAVGSSSNIPSFNFGDVVDLTIKQIETGKLTLDDMIVPDLPTSGILVRNDEELAKIMLTGKGSLKIRANVEIDGKEILVKEVPFGRTVESIISTINLLVANKKIEGILSTANLSGRKAKALLTIECKSKRVVEKVLLDLYRRNILQQVISSNMILVEDEVPVIGKGVFGIIERWVQWRKGLYEKMLKMDVADCESKMEELGYFVKLVSNEEWRDTYVGLATQKGREEAGKYLVELFEDISDDVVKWINKRSISAFHKGGEYAEKYYNLENTKSGIEYYLNGHIDEYMIKDLKELKASKAGMYERKTEVTYKDYRFSKIHSSSIEDTSFCVFTLKSDGFLTKTREVITGDNVLFSIHGEANSILVGFDNYGRVLKVIGNDIEFSSRGDAGVFLPKYFEADFQDDYKVMYLSKLDGSKKMLIYQDGFIGFFDTSEWVGKKNIKVISNGVDVSVYNMLVEVVDMEDTAEYLLVADDDGSDKIRFGLACVRDIPERSRRSRAKVFAGNNLKIKYYNFLSYMDLIQYIEDPMRYLGRVKPFKGSLFGDSADMEQGRYYSDSTPLDGAEE